MDKKYNVTVAGHICLDIIPEIPDTGVKKIDELFIPGKLIHVGPAKISPGGPVSNTGIALKKLGLKVAFMARVGDDEFGRLMLDLLEVQRPTAGVSISQEDRTSYTIAIAPPGIDRIFLHDPGANDHFCSSDLNEKIIAQSQIFHFGYPPLMARCYQDEGDELTKIFQLAKLNGATTSLDMALPDPNSLGGKVSWKIILEKVLPYVDLFLPSIEEVFFMLDPEKYCRVKTQAGAKDVIDFINPRDYSQLAEQCLQLGCKIVVLKSAHRGFYILTSDLDHSIDLGVAPPSNLKNWSNRELWCPAFHVPIIASATGSGDSSIAGFLAAYLRGYTIEKTLKYANCVGYQNLHKLDAISGIQSWEQTKTIIEHYDLELIMFPLDKHEWKWDAKHKLWIGAYDISRTSTKNFTS